MSAQNVYVNLLLSELKMLFRYSGTMVGHQQRDKVAVAGALELSNIATVHYQLFGTP